jgi:hypothetical protein
MTRKICEACGSEFSCGADEGPCWCEGVRLDAATLADLRKRYADCLCPQCLSAVAQEQAAKLPEGK